MRTVSGEPLTGWLRRRRDLNGLELDLMAAHFDLDGALAAGQWGAAWRAQEDILLAAVALHLDARGHRPSAHGERVDTAVACLDALTVINPSLGDAAWSLYLRDLPEDARVKSECERTLALVRDGLGVPAATRADAVRLWAEGVRSLREVAAALGLAQSDDWYLPEDEAGVTAWFDQVLATLETGAS